MRGSGKSAGFVDDKEDGKASFARNRKTFARPAGFTIIEVALVLAIAGLIFLVVFLALPALQKSQRDTARRQDVAKGVVAMQQYYADGGDGSDIVGKNCTGNPAGEDFSATALGPYLANAGFSSNVTKAKVLDTLKYSDCEGHPATPEMGTLDFFIGKRCVAKNTIGDYGLEDANSPYVTAVSLRLEGGGENIYCTTASR